MSPLKQLHIVDNYTPPPPLQEIPLFLLHCVYMCVFVCFCVHVRVSIIKDRGETAVKRDSVRTTSVIHQPREKCGHQISPE